MTQKIQTVFVRHIKGLAAFDLMNSGELIENKNAARQFLTAQQKTKDRESIELGNPLKPPLEDKAATSKITQFLDAHRNLLKQGRVPDHVAYFRLTICTGITVEGVKISEPCPNYKVETEKKGWGTGHCGACGCPDWPISEMHRPGKIMEPGKAWFPMSCPQSRFSGMPGRRAKTKHEKSDVVDPNFMRKEE